MNRYIRYVAAGVVSIALVASLIARADVPPVTITGSFTSSGSQPVVIGPLTGQNSCTFQEVSASAGPVDANVSNDGSNWTAVTISNMAGTSQNQPFTPSNSVTYQVTPINAAYVEIAPDSTWSTQKGTITLRCSASAAQPAPGSSGGGATPIPTPAGGVYPVTCASPGQNPCSVHDAAPVQPSPLYTQAVTTPAPAPTTTGGWVGTVGFNVGSGALFANNICDTFAKSGAISSATTTLLITGTNSQSVYVCLAAFQSTGVNASNTVQFEYGQGATCATNTQTLFPAAIAPGTATGEWLSGWAGTQNLDTQTTGMPAPAAVPLVLPNNATAYNFCGITSGTTTAGTYVVWYSIH